MTAALLLTPQASWSDPEDADAVAAVLHSLVDQGALSETAHKTIDRLHDSADIGALTQYLDALAKRGQISANTRVYLGSLLRAGVPAPEDMLASPAPASYSGNGNVNLLGKLNPRAPFTYAGPAGQLYQGVWGYVAPNGREYALLTHSQGLSIIDIGDPASPSELQFIAMSGGRVHRDVDTFYDSASGKTYAYVGGQESSNLYSIDLSALPVPSSGIVDLGRTNYAHTLQVTGGLLFLNYANGSLGCQVFDLQANPANPPLLPNSWSGSGRDCHDSFVRDGLLYSSDGYSTRWRIADISNIRNASPIQLGETGAQSGFYAHSGWLSADSHYFYAFEEFNLEDINIFDVSDPSTPTKVKAFQWSGDSSANSIVHNGQVRDDLLFVAYYEAGFRVFDLLDPLNPVEVGKYETWRDPDGEGSFTQSITGGYNGAWNVYAGLPSGNVLVSDMKSGLFIFQITAPQPPSTAPPAAPTNLSAVANTMQRGKKEVIDGIDLHFTDNADDETEFIVERWVLSGKGRNKTCNHESSWTLPAKPGTGAVAYSDDSASSSTCKYRVAASNSAGTSAYAEALL